MRKYKSPKLTEKEIHEKESMVRGRKEKTKRYRLTLPPNELLIMNYQGVKKREEIFNLIANNSKKENLAPPNSGRNCLIYYFSEPKRTVAVGRKLKQAFKKSQLAIKWSKVNSEVKVYVDFNLVA